MTLDAVLAYLHYMAIFVLFAFLTAQAVMLRAPLDERGIRLVGRADLWYGTAAMIEIHLAALIPVFAVMMARGLG